MLFEIITVLVICCASVTGFEIGDFEMMLSFSGKEQDAPMKDFPGSLEAFTALFQQCKTRSLEAVQFSKDTEGKRRVGRLLEEMEALHKEVAKAAGKVAGGRCKCLEQLTECQLI